MIDINENLESLEIPHHIMTSHSFTSPEWTFAVDVWTNNQHPLLTCFKTSFCLILRIFIVWVSRSLITLVDPSSITVVIIQAYTSAVWTLSPPQPSVCNVSDDLPSCHLTCSQSTQWLFRIWSSFSVNTFCNYFCCPHGHHPGLAELLQRTPKLCSIIKCTSPRFQMVSTS